MVNKKKKDDTHLTDEQVEALWNLETDEIDYWATAKQWASQILDIGIIITVWAIMIKLLILAWNWIL